jgi:hypothetical protein
VTELSGLEVLTNGGFELLSGQRVGLMANPSAVDRRLSSAYRLFATAPNVNLTALFAPEHSFAGVLSGMRATLFTCGDSAPSLQAAVDAILGRFIPAGQLPVPLVMTHHKPEPRGTAAIGRRRAPS